MHPNGRETMKVFELSHSHSDVPCRRYLQEQRGRTRNKQIHMLLRPSVAGSHTQWCTTCVVQWRRDGWSRQAAGGQWEWDPPFLAHANRKFGTLLMLPLPPLGSNHSPGTYSKYCHLLLCRQTNSCYVYIRPSMMPPDITAPMFSPLNASPSLSSLCQRSYLLIRC